MGRLGKAMVDRIRAMLAEGYSKTETADELGIDRKTVASYAVARAFPILGPHRTSRQTYHKVSLHLPWLEDESYILFRLLV